jgi:ketosteroid isomerase-like protein
MKIRTLCFVSLFVLMIGPAAAGEDEARAAVDRVLTSLHTAASEADGDLYFSLFADDAIFMGTDATERWAVEDFKAFAEPYFSNGRGWTYEMTERHISFSADGATAWFDEMLENENYGTCRGTGVLRKTDAGWLFVQYNLTIPIPNDLAGEISTRIKDFAKAQ